MQAKGTELEEKCATSFTVVGLVTFKLLRSFILQVADKSF